MVFVYFPNGCSLPGRKDKENAKWRWFPVDPGRDYEFTQVLEPLALYREQMTLLGGLSHPKSRELLGHLAGDTWLTAGDVRGDRYQNLISVDQVAAHVMKKHTRFPSLVLSVDGGVGYKSRVSTMSFDAAGKPVPAEHRHRSIFERYFSPDGGASSADRRKSLAQGNRIMWEHPQLPAVRAKVIKWVTTGGALALLGEAVSDASIVPGLWVAMP